MGKPETDTAPLFELGTTTELAEAAPQTTAVLRRPEEEENNEIEPLGLEAVSFRDENQFTCPRRASRLVGHRCRAGKPARWRATRSSSSLLISYKEPEVRGDPLSSPAGLTTSGGSIPSSRMPRKEDRKTEDEPRRVSSEEGSTAEWTKCGMNSSGARELNQ